MQELKVCRAMGRILFALQCPPVDLCCVPIPADREQSPPALRQRARWGCFIQGSKAPRKLDADFRSIRVQITSELPWCLTVQCQTRQGVKDRSARSVVTRREAASVNAPWQGWLRRRGRRWPARLCSACRFWPRSACCLSLQALCWAGRQDGVQI